MSKPFSEAPIELIARQVGERLVALALMTVTAESCTGGWVAKVLTDVPGSSAWVDRGFVTYSNAAKEEMLGVEPRTLSRDGAVSEAVVREMALGALARSRAQVAVAISGIAGPGGGTAAKPVGTVWLAWGLAGGRVDACCHHFPGDREAVRAQAVRAALLGVLERLPVHV